MLLTSKLVTSASPCLSALEALYEHSFPANERSPFHLLLDDPTGCSQVYAFFLENTFCGFMSLLNDADISHIIYFAVEPALRGKGIGSEMLKQIHALKHGQRLVVDIEKPIEGESDFDVRIKRKRFYQNANYAETDVSYGWRGEVYVLLTLGGSITTQQFQAFWEHVESVNPAFGKF